MRGRNIRKNPSIIDVQYQESSDGSFKDSEQDAQRQQVHVQDFSLTRNQYLMIMSKLPKKFSFQPIKNVQRSRKILSEISEKPLKKVEKQQKKEKSRRESSRMTIKFNESEDQTSNLKFMSQNQKDSRKSQRLFLRDKIVFYDLEKESDTEHPSNLTVQVPNANTFADKSQQNVTSEKANMQKQQKQQRIQQYLQSQHEENKHNNSRKDVKLRLNESLQQIDIPSSKDNHQIPYQYSKGENKLQSYEQTFAKEWQILQSLQKHTMIDPFTSPVDEVRDCATNYYSIIKKPMDLQTIEEKLKNHRYKQHFEFHADVQQMWKNSHIFNKPGSAMVKLTLQLQKYYEGLKNGKRLKKGGIENKKGRKK